MTPTVSSAESPVVPNKPTGDAVHAYVEDGRIMMMDGGRLWPVSPIKAWCEWLLCLDSPFPSTQERARQLRAAYQQVTQ